MIELQIALFIAGVIAFGVVAIISYDRYRRAKRRTGPRASGDHGAPEKAPDTDDVVYDESMIDAPAEGQDDDWEEPVLGWRRAPAIDGDFAAADEALENAPGDTRLAPSLQPPLEYHSYHPADTGDVETEVGQIAEASPTPAPASGEPGPDPTAMPEPYPEQEDTRTGSANAVPAPTSAASMQQVLNDAERLAHTPVSGIKSFEEMGMEQETDAMPIELVARIPGANVIKRDTALGIYRQYEFDLKKRHKIYGLLHPANMWCDLERQPESSGFTDFGVTLQLADRRGPATESEINRFSQMVLRFAEIFGRRFKFSIPFEQALKYAEELDDLCRKYDSVAILNVVARNDNFVGEDIDRHVREMDFKLNDRHVYQKKNPRHAGDAGLYALANIRDDGSFKPPAAGQLVTDGITLFMNIPCTRNPAEVFNDMVADAKELCRRLDGKLVDQNQRGMTQKGLKSISQNIRQLETEMVRDGLAPGGEKTQRLF